MWWDRCVDQRRDMLEPEALRRRISINPIAEVIREKATEGTQGAAKVKADPELQDQQSKRSLLHFL